MSFLLIVQLVMLGASLTAYLETGRDADAARQAVQVWLACIGLILVVQLIAGFFSQIQEPVFWLIGWRHIRVTRDPVVNIFVLRFVVSLTTGLILVSWLQLHKGLDRSARWAWFAVVLIASFWAFGSISEMLEGIWRNGRLQIGRELGVGTLQLLVALAIGRSAVIPLRRERDERYVSKLPSDC